MDPRPDFILVFSLSDEYSPIRAFGDISPSKLKSDRATQLQEEYEKLIGRLRACDLEATGRKGAEGTDTILILVRGKEKRILEEVTRERLSDWLHNVASEARPSPRSPRDFVDDSVHETERIRAVYQIMTGPRFKATTSVRSPASTGLTCGIPIILPPPTKSDFPHLISMFPPHNTTFNNTWQKRWMNISTASNGSKNPIELLSIPQSELDDLKAHLGGRVALYFAFLCFYFKSLLFPSVVGIVFWIAGLSFHPILGIAFTGWSLLMVESWRLRERALSVHWGSYNIEKVEVQRAGFRGDGLEVDPVTGVTHESWKFRKTLTRSLAVLPVYFLFVSILGGIISTIYMIETVLGEVYDGPGKKILTMIPTILFVSIVPRVTGFWRFVATKLTDFENHPYQSEYDTSLTIKLFALNFVASYGNLLLTSFVYIPFGGFLVPRIFDMLPSRHAHAIAGSAAAGIKSGSFVIDTHKLKRQLVAYSLTAQITNALTEVGIPYLKTRFGPQLAEKLPQVAEKLHLSSKENEKTLQSDSEDEKAFLERVRREQLLPAADLGGEYAEMCTQLGFIALFGVCWPLTPLWSLINNFFEIRSDAFKLATQMRRPIPTREATLGPWLDALGFITYLGTLTTSALVYLYQPQTSYKGVSAEFLSNVTHSNVTIPTNGTVPFFSTRLSMAQSSGSPAPESPLLMGALPAAPTSFTSLTSIKSLLITALLVAMFSSHGYLVFRGAARWLLERLQWDNSLPHQIVRKGELELKRAWLDENEMRLGPRDMVKKCMEWDNEERRRRLGPDGRQEEDEKKEDVGTDNTVTHRVEEEMKARQKAQEEEEQYLVGRRMGKTDLAGTDGESFWKREDEGNSIVKSLKKTE
ncbi:Ist2p [Sporobolomyces salmoneus]|uniref:Ist2p n=1 Tax=Sporobolomyces salmoneus TaxID=183962 RepID=UPI003180E319